MRRILATAAVLACTVAGLSACGDDGDGGSEGSDADPKLIKVRFSDGKVTPNGDRVDVEVGQPVEFVVAADEAGEIHIHSEPEQALEYDEGEKTFKVEFDKPGVIVVESHNLDEVIVQLEVK
jgi:plastocyanin